MFKGFLHIIILSILLLIGVMKTELTVIKSRLRYEWMTQWFRGPYKSIDELTPLHMILAGGVAGMLSWGINYPVS